MAGFDLNGIGGIKNRYSTNAIDALVSDSNLLDITQNKDLQSLILKTAAKLLSLIKIPDDNPSVTLPNSTLSEEEKKFDVNPDGNPDGKLDKQESKSKLIADFKTQLETTVLKKYNLTVDQLVEFKNLTKEERKKAIEQYVANNPKIQSTPEAISAQVNLFDSLIDKQLNAGKELFDLIKKDDRIYVSGIVIDEITGDPIKGAKVTFSSPNYEPSSNFTDTTNRKGTFTIEIPKLKEGQAPLPQLTPEEMAQINNVLNAFNGRPNLPISTTSSFNTPITNNPILIPFNGSIYIPFPIDENLDTTTVETTLTGSNITSSTNPIMLPDLSGYSLYTSKDSTGTPTQPLYTGVTDLSGSFSFSIPQDAEYITLSKGSGTSIILYNTYNTSELNLEEPNLIEVSNIQSNSTTLSNSTIQTPEIAINSPSEDIITVEKSKYSKGNFSPYKGDGTIKNKVVFKLTPIIKSLEVEKINALLPNVATTQEMTKSKKDAKWYQNEKLAQVSRELQSTMVPIILTMAASFGISELEKVIQKGKDNLLKEISCPTTPEGQYAQDEVIKIINKKNKLVKQLNNTLNTINNTTKALSIAGTSIEIMNASYIILKNIPIPSSTGIPGVPGIPINVINNVQDSKVKIEKLIATLRGFNMGILATLVILRQTLIKIISLLSALDTAIQFCSPESSQEQISAELLALTIQQTEQTSPIVVNVNGFDLAIETETTTNPLKRKRAIAKNKSNVIMLQGEWSFSSIDQILMDELVFYIQVNNLKAD
jgi:hypothetical protein